VARRAHAWSGEALVDVGDDLAALAAEHSRDAIGLTVSEAPGQQSCFVGGRLWVSKRGNLDVARINAQAPLELLSRRGSCPAILKSGGQDSQFGLPRPDFGYRA
jgi:hypothetical protein